MGAITPGLQIGRYIVRTKLGAGGMAEVYLADDTQLGRRVALKFLPPETEGDTVAQRRLLREARAAATLDHPHICSVYEVGEAEGRHYIAMQYVDGEALDVRLRRSKLDLSETLAIAVQVVDALSEAHAHGILHRDIKPGNVMVTARGQAKVMDFGLAKVALDDAVADGAATVSLLSARGDIIGTGPYMSPEQARGEPLDPRSDLFSVGVLLYEMVSGQRPFQGTSSAAVAAAILKDDPPPLARFALATPPELERIVAKALKKDADNRYQTAKDLLIDLRALKEEYDFQLKLGRTPTPSAIAGDQADAAASAASGQIAPTSSARSVIVPVQGLWWAVAIAAAVIVLAAGGWFAWRSSNTRWARAQLAQITTLADARDYFAAYDLAVSVEPYLPGDSTLAGLMPVISDSVSVTTTPPGAAVYLTRFDSATTSSLRQLLGTTPVTNARIARGEYILSIEKDGFAPSQRTVSGKRVTVGTLAITPPPIRIDQSLIAATTQPAGMVSVPGGDYRLISWSAPTDRRVRLSNYFIDKYEVSNREYKEFISGGGYLKRDLWKYRFEKDGRPLSWDEAMKVLVDRTGLPGPRSWSNQNFQDGKGDHPVADITWYEAAAYAAFRGKQLPTVFQWEKAARNGVVGPAGVAVMPWGLFYPGDSLTGRANFGLMPQPTTSAEFGMSPFGAHNMAGNVAEWTLNDSSDGFLTAGGAWGDPTYTFGNFGGRPGFFSSSQLGFRCALNANADAGDQGGTRFEIAQEIPRYAASSQQVFASLAASYRYEKTPLDPRVEETTDGPEWKREKITFNGANGQRAIAYLYLPNHVPRPLQLIHYVPAGDVDDGFRSLSESMDDIMTPYVRAGRAVFGVVVDGYIGRLRPGVARPASSTDEFVEWIVSRVTDLRRGLDFLETRPDIDRTRMAIVAPSAGSRLGLVVAALETRYRALVFMGAGLPSSYRTIAAAANPINFTPHLRPPKLIVQGRHDELMPLRTATEPFFKLLTEPKRLILYDGGHMPPIETRMSITSGWLDEQLGRVAR